MMWTEKYVLVKKYQLMGWTWAYNWIRKGRRSSGNALILRQKIPGAVVYKEIHTDSLMKHEGTHHYYLPN